LLFDIKTPSDASMVADKILHTLRQPLNISGHQLVVTTSIGITIVPQDGTDPNSLMKNADLAMYRAKDHGRNTYHFYSEEMNTNAIKRLRTEYELRRALERNEFVLHYQPKVRLADQQIVGVECLIRWEHPERGLLAPYEFIEVAEETGAIVDMGTWIIQEACRTGQELSEQAKRNFQIAVNISPRQFRDPNLVATIRRNLRESGLNPSTLELEITETMLMGDVEAANTTVRQLHELGVRMAIDDFGTGYSSLNYLKKFPINTVKVDRSFIMDIPESADDKAITSAVIAMAHRLNMEVVAEGVETHEQLNFLLEHDCEYAQGFLFAKPLSLDNLRPMILPNVRVMRSRKS
jgi:EAL domain-containing protein (putative c-di-GMP-specific phosphodiesterase class I)